MAAALSSTITLPVSSSTSRKMTSLSSSSSVFFSYNGAGSGSGVSLNRPRLGRVEKRGFSCNCIFGLGVPELVVIVFVSTLVFGPKQLPEVGRSIGKTVKSFQQAAKEFESELRKDGEASGENVITVKEEQQIEA